MIVSPNNLKLDAGPTLQSSLGNFRPGSQFVSRLLAKAWLLVAAVAIAQATAVGSQVGAQPIFRMPQQSRLGGEALLQLTGPSESRASENRMAPIRKVGTGEGSTIRFQLPQTEPARGFFPGNSQSSQFDQGGESQNFRTQIREPELRELSADGTFLPAPSDFGGDQNQVEAMDDLPGLDLSALGLDLEGQQDAEGRTAGSDFGGENLERLPAPLGGLDVPSERARESKNIRREQVVENYPDGKPRLLRTVALDREGNYYNDGPWVVKDRDGEVVAAGTYRKGVMQGQWARRHTTAEGGMFAEKPFTSYQGPFDSMANFKAGKLDGQWIVYDRAKRSIFEIGYEDGKRNGLATWFYPDTTKMRQATFKQGVLDGEVSEWDEEGRLVSKEFYTDGRKLIRNTSFYRPKVPKEESYYLDVKLRQNGLDNWWDAKPAPYLASGKRIQNGQARAWYSNRQLQYQGQFRDDKPVGRFFWWHENGNRSTVGQFNRAGDREGRWIWWHDNGMKSIEGNYKNDQTSGVWRSWDQAGKLIKSKDYDRLSLGDDDDQIKPLQGLDPQDEEELLEGTVKTEPRDASSLSDDPGQIQDNGFLPLPQDGSDAGQVESANPNGPTEQNEPSQAPQFESLPPALGEESFDNEFNAQKSIMRSVGAGQERSIVERKPITESMTGDFEIRPSVGLEAGQETGSALLSNELNESVESSDQVERVWASPLPAIPDVVDDAVEPFDLSDLLD